MAIMNTTKIFAFSSGLFLLLMLLVSSLSNAQDNLFEMLREESGVTETALLPEKMIFTQRWLWGEKGLMRKT